MKGFSLAMIMGVIFGTYSSIYIANPILVKLRVSQKTILKEDLRININIRFCAATIDSNIGSDKSVLVLEKTTLQF